MTATARTEVAANEAARSPILSESAAVIQMLERAVLNPDVDIEKMERLFAMRERMEATDAKRAYFAAMAEVQVELPAIAEKGGIKNNAGKVQSTYARWEDINEAIKPVLSRHGFALSFRTGQDNGQIVVTGILSHAQGHMEETTMRLPIDGSGSKNAVQSIGSSTSYG
ncbi:MAG: ERF family protein, partial [Moraxellaceae bacterium]